MNEVTPVMDWFDVNRLALAAHLARLRELMGGAGAAGNPIAAPRPDPDAAPRRQQPPSALDALIERLGLSPFERDVLLLCAGVELDAELALACAARAGGESGRPSFALALDLLSEPDWRAVTPARPLRRWRLIEVADRGSLTGAALRIDEWVLHYLQGYVYIDERLRPFVETIAAPDTLPRSQAVVADQAIELWDDDDDGAEQRPHIHLGGEDPAGRIAVAAAACAARGLSLLHIRPDALVLPPAERAAVAVLCARHAQLCDAALAIESREHESAAGAGRRNAEFMDALGVPLFVLGEELVRPHGYPSIRLRVPRPTLLEQQALWREGLLEVWEQHGQQLAGVVARFDFDARTVAAASALARRFMAHEAPERAVAHACRLQVQAPLEGLANLLEPRATLADLVLSDVQLGLLREIEAQARHRTRVHEEWGFARATTRGLGISVLFSGPSGTGKTMAAEALANELRQDLYRIDLSAVVSKYIGETEKNLQRVFAAAEQGGVVLLFDEADALFGKRSEVKDSHDRFANVEVSYLLQRMESYRGVAILTTNQRPSIDAAFMRRLRFIVDFPFPDAEQRARIWQGVFPSSVPTHGLKYERLSQLAATGGSIRNIAINAAFAAAEEGESVAMHHIARAARCECSKLDRSLSAAETEGWT
jgi:hypothetical protein